MSFSPSNLEEALAFETSLINNQKKCISQQEDWESLIKFYARNKKSDEIIRISEIAINKDCLGTDGYVKYLSSLIETNQSSIALEVIQALNNYLFDDPRIQLQIARAYIQVKNYEQAFTISSDLIKLNPNDASVSGLLILSLAIQNKFELLFDYIKQAPHEALTADWAILAMCVHYRKSSVAEALSSILMDAINKISKAKAPNENLWSIRLKRIAGLASYARIELDQLGEKELGDENLKRELGLCIAESEDWTKGKDIYQYFSESNCNHPETKMLTLWNTRFEVIKQNYIKEHFEQADYKFPDSLFEILYRSTKIPFYTPIKGRVALLNGTMGGGGAEKAMARTFLKMKSHTNLKPELWLYSINSNHNHNIVLKGLNIPETNDAGVYVLNRKVDVAHPFDLFPKPFSVNISAIYAQILDRKPEVIHAWEDSVNLETAVAALLAGVRKIIIHPHNMRPDKVHNNEHIGSFRRAYKELLNRSEVQFITVSHSALADYKTWMDIEENKRCHVVYNGFDWVNFPDESRINDITIKFKASLGIPPETKLVGGIFRFAPLKRPYFWVDVAHHVLQKNDNLRFVLFGQGEEYENTKNYVHKLGISEKVHFLGYVQTISTDVFALDALLHTSETEGLPTVIIEAGSAGVPVLATDVGGVSECIDDRISVTLPLESTCEQFSTVLTKLINKPLDYSTRLEVATKIRSTFKIEDMLKKFENIYYH